MQEPEVAERGEPSHVVDVHYRKLDRDDADFPNEITLAQALRNALRRTIEGTTLQSNVRHRVQNAVLGKPGDIRCWNNIQTAPGMLFGTLCLYRPSELQAVIASRHIRGPVDAFPLDQIDEASGRDFLRAIAYWMAVEDHFYLIQSPSIQTGAVEDYFEWLLRKVRLLDDGHHVRMLAAFDRDAVGGDLEDLTSLNVGGAFEPEPAEGPAPERVRIRPGALDIHPGEDVERRRVGRRPFVPNAWEILHQVIHDQRSIEEIQSSYRELRAVDPNATLDVEMEFYVRLHKRRSEDVKEARQRALQALSSGLRDMPDGTVTARGRDGMVTGNEIRLKAPRRIRLAPPPAGAHEGARSTLLDLDHAFEEMRRVHTRFEEDGKL